MPSLYCGDKAFSLTTDINGLHHETGKDDCARRLKIRNDSIAIGEARGEARGEVKGFLDAMISLVKDGILTVADAAERANMTVAEFEAKTGLKA